MEWIESQWNLEAEVDTTTATGLAEAEINIPSDQDGALRFLCCQARVENVSAEAGQDQVSVEGTVNFTVLYETASGLDSIPSRNSFAHTLTMPKVQTGQRVQIKAAALSTQVRWINERQCRVECVLEMQAAVYSRQQKTLLTDMENAEAEKLHKPIRGAWVTGTSRRVFTLKEDVELDAALPDAARIMLCQGQVELDSLSSQAGQVNAEGRVQLDVLYSTEDAQKLARVRLPFAFSEQWDASELGQSQWLMGEGRLQECRVRIFENIRGEQRVLAVEVQVMLTAQGYADQQTRALVDAYSVREEIMMEYEHWLVPGAPEQAQTEIVVSGQMKLPDGAVLPEKILQVLVNPVVDSVAVENDRATLTGRLMTHVIHGNSEGMLGCITAAAPFEGAAAAPGLKPGDWLQVETTSTMPSAQVTQEGLQVRDTLDIALIWRSTTEEKVAAAAQSRPWPDDLPQGLSLVVVQPGEDNWQMAKRCRIPLSALVKTNAQLEKRQVESGECLVVERA